MLPAAVTISSVIVTRGGMMRSARRWSRKWLSRKTKRSSMGPDRASRKPTKTGTVSSLRPAAAITVLESARIVQAAQLMAAKRADAVLAVTEEGQLSGILTDKDIAYRVVAEGLDSRTTTVAQVMTRNPFLNEALGIMVSRRFRHLPVIAANEEDEEDFDDGGTNVVVCVERLDDLERKVLERRGTVNSDHVDVIKSQHGCPDLASVLSRTNADDVPEVGVKASVRDAARVMKDYHQTAILVLSAADGEDRLGGIFTTKDIVLRVIAAGLDPATTSVVRVMTPHPDSVPSSFSILDALKKLNIGHYLHLPVVDNGSIFGLVDVMTLTMAMLDYLLAKDQGTEAPVGPDSGPMWNKFWNSTFAGGSVVDTESDIYSVNNEDTRSITSANAYHNQQHQPQHQPQQPVSKSPPATTQLPLLTSSRTVSQVYGDDLRFGFKLRDTRTNKVFRFTSSSTDLNELLGHVKSKTGVAVSGDDAPGTTVSPTKTMRVMLFTFLLTVILDAVAMARKAGWTKLSLFAGIPGAAPAADAASVTDSISRSLDPNQSLWSLLARMLLFRGGLRRRHL
ncbi:hypothetical protein BC829DRAFT_425517 [Chytridium lagenaria]|nr:hypothetical protein BC829DRAFT_425517 [Chytridium lagenaria]